MPHQAMVSHQATASHQRCVYVERLHPLNRLHERLHPLERLHQPKRHSVLNPKSGPYYPRPHSRREKPPCAPDPVQSSTCEAVQVFPFLDLAPEMRNLIYPYLLKHNRGEGSVAHPAILRTCKQLYKETSPMLNHESLVQLSIRFTFFGWGETGNLDYSIGGRCLSARLKCTSHIKEILTNMRHVQHIAINIGPLPGGPGWRLSGRVALDRLNDIAADMTQFFTSLLEACESLQTLEVNFVKDWNKEMRLDGDFLQMTKMFEQLEKCRDSFELKLQGVEESTLKLILGHREYLRSLGKSL
ncbi:hypothetical protein PRZ48_011021 [Zasmidium cellare]|uniref:Uncharacterized protein n=1 Tax=Zasmidium cellare TaxID=395010 RepID=A0ABR0EA97_ZASCE|nr:hypothetical protein PRZ48_011021 [Zasmidium cellare]